MKEAENVVNTRSQDLRGVIAQLRSTVKRASIDIPHSI